MTTTYLAPLPMSQTKDDLLGYLGMSSETYTMMAKEAERVYKHLTSDRRHRKNNCKRNPPYDWSDIVEKSKDEAMRAIAHGGTPHTNYYWGLGQPIHPDKEPNWVAKWFLYRKFRYRDGRRRNTVNGDDGTHSYHNGVKHCHHRHCGGEEDHSGAQQAPEAPTGHNTSRGGARGSGKLIYDPVRDQ